MPGYRMRLAITVFGISMPRKKVRVARLEMDVEHRVPKLEYLLGLTLLKRSAYEDAAQHLRAFLSVATNPADIAESQKQLNETVRLAAAANSATTEGK